MRQELFIKNERPTTSASNVGSTASSESKTATAVQMMALSTDPVAWSRFWKTGDHIISFPEFGGELKMKSVSVQNG